MSKVSTDVLRLEGPGAAYVRVSDEKQDAERQRTAIQLFEKRHNIRIPPTHWFTDIDYARDEADERPEFQRLLKLAEQGQVRWIVVSERDRFGTADADELMHYRYQLRRWGVSLYDAHDVDWTSKGLERVILAAMSGAKSEQEQQDLSERVLTGKAAGAARGEWQGGVVPLGFDAVCLARETGKEKWRVVFEGRSRRRVLYADGRQERYDGKYNVPPHNKKMEFYRLAPSVNQERLDTAVQLFTRYATEAITLSALASWLDSLGIRNSQGGVYQGHHLADLLADTIFLGVYSWNRRTAGKFHQLVGGRPVAKDNPRAGDRPHAQADHIQSQRLFEPLVERTVWNRVQEKLAEEEGGKKRRVPVKAAWYLAGLLHCSHCGLPMNVGKSLKSGHEYLSRSYARAVVRSKATRGRALRACKCKRYNVTQEAVQPYLLRYLEETGEKLKVMTAAPPLDAPTGQLEDRYYPTFLESENSFVRLLDYVYRHAPEAKLRQLDPGDKNEFPPREPTPDDFFEQLLDLYRQFFDPTAHAAELAQLDAEHTRLTDKWDELPTPLAKAKVKAQLEALETRILALRQLSADLADRVEAHRREVRALEEALDAAKVALAGAAGERKDRFLANQLRSVLLRIDCTFQKTGAKGVGHARRHSVLTELKFIPKEGASRTLVIPRTFVGARSK
jgi:DNA invertase Pin-like site-specific DNA recombinase